jgi:hypothetical protein
VDKTVDGTMNFETNRPDVTVFTETSKEQEVRVRAASPFGHLKTWRLFRIIVKANDDVR